VESIQCEEANHNLISRKLVNFQPEDYERIKQTLLQDITVVARLFCDSEMNMIQAINTGQLLIGTLDDYRGDFCIYLEYLCMQVIKPIRVCH
jgi:hypothetical protein